MLSSVLVCVAEAAGVDVGAGGGDVVGRDVGVIVGSGVAIHHPESGQVSGILSSPDSFHEVILTQSISSACRSKSGVPVHVGNQMPSHKRPAMVGTWVRLVTMQRSSM